MAFKDRRPFEHNDLFSSEASKRQRGLSPAEEEETMSIKIALAGNPNCGKTTLFNGLTGSHQTVGNWPGVTVEQIVGEFTYKDRQVKIVDLPGIYSLQPSSASRSISWICPDAKRMARAG